MTLDNAQNARASDLDSDKRGTYESSYSFLSLGRNEGGWCTMNLTEKIELVFSDESRLYNMTRVFPSEKSMGSINTGSVPPGALLASKSQQNFVTSQNVERLLKLHAMLSTTEQKQFYEFMLSHLTMSNELSYLSFLVLHRLGHTVTAIKMACTPYLVQANKKNTDSFRNVTRALSALLATEYGQLSGKWCEDVRNALGTTVEFSSILRDRLNSVLLLHLDAELGDANPEIYADRDRVISIWETRFGDATIPELIVEIDQYFRDGEVSELKLATCVSRIRTLLVHVARAVADKHSQKGGKALSPNADEHVVFQYLRTSKLVDDHEWNVLRSLHGKASNEGSHSLTAKMEEARLIKNMAYEFLLLLLSRAA